MSDLNTFKKADLLSVARKVGINVLTKDTKKVLVEKISSFIQTNPKEALDAIRSIEQSNEDDDDEGHTLVEEEVLVIVEDTADADADADDDATDEDYNAPPPINIKAKVIDPIIEYWENLIDKVYEFTDKVGITTLTYNDELRENLSSSITLNYLQLIGEFSYFLFLTIPWVALKDNKLIDPLLKDNISFLAESELPTPNLCVFLHPDVIIAVFLWVIIALVVPLITSYYVNFSRRVLVFDDEEGIVARIYKYDPVVFALTKALLNFFVNKNASDLLKISGLSLKYIEFVDDLGSFPFVIGVANVVIGIYSQFEDY